LAALVSMLVLVIVPGGLLSLVGAQIASQWQELTAQTSGIVGQLTDWLAEGPLHIDEQQLDSLLAQAAEFMRAQMSTWADVITSTGQGLLAFLTGLIMCLFAVFFFLKDGRRIANTVSRILPASFVVAARPATIQGWNYMVSYVRAAILVAAVDGVGAGIGAAILGSNLWVAIMVLTFVCSFVPMLGALIAGTIGTLVVLATLGWFKAILMVVIFVLVLELEVHILQPLLLSRAVDIHPLAVLVGIAIGMIVAGIPGAVFAIPIVAMLVGVVREVLARRDQAATESAEPQQE
jgi:predicted PurR-regulated permease PerM